MVAVNDTVTIVRKEGRRWTPIVFSITLIDLDFAGSGEN